jgi:hypothetical protein
VTRSRPRRWQLLLICAVAIGIAEPYVEIAWKCRAGMEASEACVWGRSFLPLGKWLAPVIVTPIAFVALLFLAACIDWACSRRD